MRGVHRRSYLSDVWACICVDVLRSSCDNANARANANGRAILRRRVLLKLHQLPDKLWARLFQFAI